MFDDKEERIRTEAYRRWEQEGRPNGHHDRHWQEAASAVEAGSASDIVETEGTTQAVKTPKLRASKPKAAKAAEVAAVAEPKARKAAPVTKAEAEPPKRSRAKKIPTE